MVHMTQILWMLVSYDELLPNLNFIQESFSELDDDKCDECEEINDKILDLPELAKGVDLLLDPEEDRRFCIFYCRFCISSHILCTSCGVDCGW